MSAGVNYLIQRGQRLARSLRPATLIYGGNEIPCTPGNLEFFERLRADGGGFSVHKGQFITLLRADIPTGVTFKRGQNCAVRDEDSGDVFNLKVGENNSTQAAVMILNLQSDAA
jgi:hypothetical protein